LVLRPLTREKDSSTRQDEVARTSYTVEFSV